MRRYIYILMTLLLLGACTNSDFESDDLDNSSIVTVLENGDLMFSLDLKIADMDEREVATRSTLIGNEGKIEDGWIFVFGEGTPGSAGAIEVDGVTYADDSKLLQKMPYKKGPNGKVFFTISPQTEPCYLRMWANVTGIVDQAITNLIEGVSTLDDYKHISEPLTSYYDVDYDALFDGSDIPDPNQLRTRKLGYPAVSPGYTFPNGISSEIIEEFNHDIGGEAIMVPIGSKVTVSIDPICNFQLKEVYALNVAKRAMMRSTVLKDDGVSVETSFPVPTNFGGTTKTKAVVAVGNSTVSKPIYIFPNEGDAPFDNGFGDEVDFLGNKIEEPTKYPASGIDTDGDGKGDTNPTYIIVKGRAEGYVVDGYYKIALINSDDKYTYDILRNGHYKVNIYDVDNPGYRTAAEAEVAPSSEISYDITIGAGDDGRNIIKVSNNGLFSTEFDTNMVYAQGYGTAGVDAEFSVKLTDNDTEDTFFTSSSEATISVVEGGSNITLASGCDKVVADGVMKTIKFRVKGDGVIRLSCGDLIQYVKVIYKPLGAIIKRSVLTDNAGDEIFTSSANTIEDFETGYTPALEMVNKSGDVKSNAGNYTNRECRAKFFRAGGKGAVKVYLRQASDFKLDTHYDNSTAGSGGNSGTNNIFTAVDGKTNEYTTTIEYQSSGKVYQLNDANNGTITDGIMTSWTIGTAPIEITTYGDFETELTPSISNYFTADDWSDLSNGATPTTVNIKANDIGENTSGHTEEISKPVLTLTNIAGESKVYNMNLSQIAKPFVDRVENPDVTYDAANNMYVWTCDLIADLYTFFGDGNKYATTTSPVIKNVRYVSGAEGFGDWKWTESTGSDGYSGGPKSKERVSTAFGVIPDRENDPITVRDYYFTITVTGRYDSIKRGKMEAYFDLDMSNGTAERVRYRFKMRRDDGNE